MRRKGREQEQVVGVRLQTTREPLVVPFCPSRRALRIQTTLKVITPPPPLDREAEHRAWLREWELHQRTAVAARCLRRLLLRRLQRLLLHGQAPILWLLTFTTTKAQPMPPLEAL
jgi:hypothetical protein